MTEVQAGGRDSRTRPVSRVMIVTARAVGLGRLAACDRRLVMDDALTCLMGQDSGVSDGAAR
jgi:hypothetical protein